MKIYDAQQLATVLYERRQSVKRTKGSHTHKAHTLSYLSALVEDLYYTFIEDRFYAISFQKWKSACEQGTSLYRDGQANVIPLRNGRVQKRSRMHYLKS